MSLIPEIALLADLIEQKLHKKASVASPGSTAPDAAPRLEDDLTLPADPVADSDAA